MHPADEFAQVRSEIKRLETRAKTLRRRFLKGDVPLESNAHVVNVREQKRRVLMRDALPDHILDDPRFWEERCSPIVTVKPRSGVAKPTRVHVESVLDEDDDFDVIEG